MVFLLLKRHGGFVEWWNIDASSKQYLDRYREPNCPQIKLYNGGGGWNELGKESDTILEVLEAKDWDVLEKLEHRQKTSTYKNLVKNSNRKELKCGWLEPNGKMHYCEYHDHISYVHVVLGTDVSEIEKHGWLHILKGDDGGSPSWYSKNRITQEQARTLREELGCHVFDEQILYQ